MPIRTPQELQAALDRALRETPVTDIHTHLYAPAFGDLLLWGVDELLTYHYLVAEFFRRSAMPYEEFWKLPRPAQADLIWRTLFVESTPVSEACRGVLTVLERLGLDPGRRDLAAYRAFFAGRSRERQIDLVFEKAGLRDCVMTNDPFDDRERPVWLAGAPADTRFKAALRIDPVLLDWARAGPRLREWGYRVEPEPDARTFDEVRRFLEEWARRTRALYVGVSLPPAFAMPEESATARLLERAVLPACRDLGLALALMIGVKRRVHPELELAGDAVGRARIEAVEYLCGRFPANRFMVTMLSRENQHELCVAARKFRNLLPFGCWWFVNVPGLIEEITRMRLELLGTSFVAQHSDARVLEQVLYKWEHSRRVLGKVLFEKYAGLLEAGWAIEEREVRRDVEELLGGRFWAFLGRRPSEA